MPVFRPDRYPQHAEQQTAAGGRAERQPVTEITPLEDLHHSERRKHQRLAEPREEPGQSHANLDDEHGGDPDPSWSGMNKPTKQQEYQSEASRIDRHQDLTNGWITGRY